MELSFWPKHRLGDRGISESRKPDDDEATTALLNRLLETAVDGVPSGVFGRVSRLAGTMARAGVAFGARRLGVKGALDEAILERLVQSLGTMKGVAMKAGQILSYTARRGLPRPP